MTWPRVERGPSYYLCITDVLCWTYARRVLPGLISLIL
jgi:hypothetical protein